MACQAKITVIALEECKRMMNDLKDIIRRIGPIPIEGQQAMNEAEKLMEELTLSSSPISRDVVGETG